MKSLFLIVVGFTFISCAHHRDVRPNANGTHLVQFQTETKDHGYRNAKAQADHFCEQSKKMAYVKKEGYKYTGEMDEETYKTTKTASKIAQGVGGAGYVFGGKKENTAGGIVGLGGAIASGVAGQGYTYKMTFVCK